MDLSRTFTAATPQAEAAPRPGRVSAGVAAAALWVLAVAQLAACMGLTVRNLLTPERYVAEYIVYVVAATLSFATVGLLICRRRPSNAVGWLLLSAGVGFGTVSVIHQYVRYALVTEPGSLPAGEAIAWLNFWVWIPVTALAVVYLPLLFPNGRPPTARWRPVLWLAGAATAAVSLSLALSPGPLDDTLPEVANPLAPAWADSVNAVLDSIALALTLVSLFAAVAAPIARYRQARDVERHQLKWFAYAAVLVVAAFILPAAIDPSGFTENTLLAGTVQAVAIPLLPAAVGIAIFRYRLFDIDLLINRTLVYASLSVLLALVYLGGVVLVGALLRALTGQQDELAVAASTLAVAALFGPARRRIQAFIDRRFYRSRYDAALTLESFSGRLRDEVDLDALRGDLLSVVGDTLRPAHASVWLRR